MSRSATPSVPLTCPRFREFRHEPGRLAMEQTRAQLHAVVVRALTRAAVPGPRNRHPCPDRAQTFGFFPPHHAASWRVLIRLGLAQIKPSIHEITREQGATPRGPAGHRSIAIRGARLDGWSSGCRAHTKSDARGPTTSARRLDIKSAQCAGVFKPVRY
jgi:hypothetical protein